MNELELKNAINNEKKGNYIILSEWFGGKTPEYNGIIVNLDTMVVKDFKSSGKFENGIVITNNEINTIGIFSKSGKELLGEYINNDPIFGFNKISNMVIDAGTDIEIRFNNIRCSLSNCDKRYTNDKVRYYNILLGIINNNISYNNNKDNFDDEISNILDNKNDELNDLINKFNTNLDKELSNMKKDDNIFDSIKDLDFDELLNLRKNKIIQCNNKINNIDLNETEMNNPGFVFWSAKTIMENIKYIDSKIINKYSNNISTDDFNKYKSEVEILESTKYSNIEDIKNTINKLI